MMSSMKLKGNKQFVACRPNSATHLRQSRTFQTYKVPAGKNRHACGGTLGAGDCCCCAGDATASAAAGVCFFLDACCPADTHFCTLSCCPSRSVPSHFRASSYPSTCIMTMSHSESSLSTDSMLWNPHDTLPIS